MEWVENYYLWIKALHVISFIAWMAGLLYLPRLYVYHAQVKPGSEASETFKVMERKLLKYITTPAMIATFVFGLLLIKGLGIEGLRGQGWIHAKLTLVLGLAGFHGACAVWRKKFLADANTSSVKFYKIMNEVPTVLMIIIVILAVVKPF
jgi:putative membrane protein